jgi:hypothetical protein
MAFPNPTDPYTSADLAAMIGEIWSDMVLMPNFAPATAANFFTDLSSYAEDGGDIIHVPDLFTNVFAAQTQSTQGNGVVDESVAQVDVTLTINTHKYVAWIIGDKDMKQLFAKYALNSKYIEIATKVLIDELEDSLFGLWSSISTNTVGDTATVLTDNEIVQAINALDSTNYNVMGEGAFFFHPFVYWRQVATIAKYYTWNTSQLPIVRTGNFGSMDASTGLRGQLYGIPIYVSSNVVNGLSTYRNILALPEAFGFALQTRGASKIRAQVEYLLQNLGTLAVVDIIYGVVALREAAAVLINANDTAITS